MSDQLTKHTLNLRKGDYERLRALFPDIGAAVIIRKIVSKFLDKTEADGKSGLKVEIEL